MFTSVLEGDRNCTCCTMESKTLTSSSVTKLHYLMLCRLDDNLGESESVAHDRWVIRFPLWRTAWSPLTWVLDVRLCVCADFGCGWLRLKWIWVTPWEVNSHIWHCGVVHISGELERNLLIFVPPLGSCVFFFIQQESFDQSGHKQSVLHPHTLALCIKWLDQARDQKHPDKLLQIRSASWKTSGNRFVSTKQLIIHRSQKVTKSIKEIWWMFPL